jgi:hypothetical protein
LVDLLREKNTVLAEKNKLKKTDYKPDEQSRSERIAWNLSQDDCACSFKVRRGIGLRMIVLALLKCGEELDS